jgi:cytochrome P450
MLWAASRLPYSYFNLKGQLVYKTTELHEKYGPVVRIGPDELSFTTPTAWKTIYGHRPSEMPKSIAGHSHVPRNGGAASILTAAKGDHSRIRRSIAHAFSDKAVREQEHYLQDYVTVLITQLHKNASTGPLDMVEWYNFTTFDAIGGMRYLKWTVVVSMLIN